MTQQLSARQPHYKRVLLKLSGEALMGSEEFSIDPEVPDRMVLGIGQLVRIGVQVGLVIGGGNLFRDTALSVTGMDRVTGDHMGILATVTNGLAIRDALERSDVPALAISAISMVGVIDHYDRHKAIRHPGSDEVVISSTGTGNPFFATDSAACLRAIEIDADVVLKATKVDNVYTANSFKDPNAERFERLTYDEMLDHKLGVMNPTTTYLCRDRSVPLRVFNISKPDALLNIVVGGAEGALIGEG